MVEIELVKENLDKESKKIDVGNLELEKVEIELRELQSKLDQQKEEVTILEKEFKNVNMKDFQVLLSSKRKNKSLEFGEGKLYICFCYLLFIFFINV